MFRAAGLALCLLFAAVSACSSTASSPPVNTCLSDTVWTGGTRGAEEMSPGRDCIACHAMGSDTVPKWTLAGTVYAAPGQEDDCFGLSGVEVVITDARGERISMVTNGAGNLHALAAFETPYSVVMSLNGKQSASKVPHVSGACNACHAQAGAKGASGRLLAPQ